MPKYVSIDIETTGIDPLEDQILEFAAVAKVDDRPLAHMPTFQRIIDPGGRISGSPFALRMNARLIDAIADGRGVYMNEAMADFAKWLEELGVTPENQAHPIGKNFSAFDLQFLKEYDLWPDDLIHRRSLDAGAFYADADGIPSLATIEVEADIPGEPHEALYDARYALAAVQQGMSQQRVTFVLTRSGESGILGVFSSQEKAEAKKAECFDPDEMRITAHVIDDF